MSKEKKKSLRSGCFKIVALGVVVIIALAFIGSWMAENEWKKTRPQVIEDAQEALNQGDYKKAISLIEPYKDKDDPQLKQFLSSANQLKREAQEKLRQDRITSLVKEIEDLTGEERKLKLNELIDLDPTTTQYSDEVTVIKEERRKRQEEELAKREAERKKRLKMEEEAKKEQARKALEAKLAEFKWKYQVDKDDLTDKPTHIAWVKSINTVNFDFPYQGEQRGELWMRTHPQHGKDLIIRVKKGQMLVRSYEDSKVKVVFDKGSPVTYSVVGPSDHGTTSLFFRDYHGFVARMLKSKKVKISVPFYQQGNVVFEFNVSDFDTKKYLQKN